MRYGWAEALSRTGQFYSAIIGQFYPGVDNLSSYAAAGWSDQMFQSLSGFQVRCNIMSALFEAAPGIGFNPYRVFKFVATVLILMTSSDTSIGFNPYRVFKFVATLLGTVLCI